MRFPTVDTPIKVEGIDYVAKVVEVEGRWIVTSIWFGNPAEIFTGTKAECDKYAKRV